MDYYSTSNIHSFFIYLIFFLIIETPDFMWKYKEALRFNIIVELIWCNIVTIRLDKNSYLLITRLLS